MLQLIVNQRDTVEAIYVFRPTVAIHPNARRPDDFAPFGARYRLERTPKGHSAPRRHLDEGNQMPAPGDEIELDAAYAKSVRDNVPTLRLEKTDGLLFTGQPALMAGICPIRWIAVNAARHGAKVASESRMPSPKIRVMDHYSTPSTEDAKRPRRLRRPRAALPTPLGFATGHPATRGWVRHARRSADLRCATAGSSHAGGRAAPAGARAQSRAASRRQGSRPADGRSRLRQKTGSRTPVDRPRRHRFRGYRWTIQGHAAAAR